MAMAEQAVALAEELGLRDRVVFFNDGWVPYAERGRYLLDADVAVSAHFDDVETRFAFRTRLLDCLWAGLPVVTTRGDTLGDAIVAAGAGRAVELGDVAGWVGSARAAARRRRRARARRATRPPQLRPRFEWSRVAEPLRSSPTSRTSVSPQAVLPGSSRPRTSRSGCGSASRGTASPARPRQARRRGAATARVP